jgi:predicted transcriptional regulator
MAGLAQDGTVGSAAHAGWVSQSKHKAARRARKVHPDRRKRATAAQLDPVGRVGQLPEAKLLERIRQARIGRDEAEEELAVLIEAAVSQGVGWPEIAAQLGLTRQGARQQYQRRHPAGASQRG